ncbi:hydrogenase accessory protein [Cognatiyoonia sp. IB215182]|uniref:hydrogenase accessory protein n=1 Tax=Cognatiyoonia sp. IB215182 TaxID=3097353 RepID=UPI002A0B229C|nr:hydrogenase accessory protein [Cognatiyoonia sp. IB215182]MDX8355477.1 hydrogenase accessory protein [Cognatiyoonia sp. IB215182]
MGHPLIDRLTHELGWSSLSTEDEVLAFISRPGAHALFVPGDVERNLETPDVAVIVPELVAAFQGRFDCAIVVDEMHGMVKNASGINKTPSLIFYRDGVCLGGIPKVRDWDDYIARITRFLDLPIAAE